MVVDTLFNATQNLGRVDRFGTHSQVLLEEIGINHRSRNTHRDTANGEVGTATHGSDRLCRTCKTEQFLLYIRRDAVVADILDVTAVDTESGKSLLRVCSQYRCKVYRTWPLGTIESPHRFRVMWMHVHSLGTVTPTGGDSDCGAYASAFKLLCTCGTLTHTSDGSIRYHTLYRCAIAILQVVAYQF